MTPVWLSAAGLPHWPHRQIPDRFLDASRQLQAASWDVFENRTKPDDQTEQALAFLDAGLTDSPFFLYLALHRAAITKRPHPNICRR